MYNFHFLSTPPYQLSIVLFVVVWSNYQTSIRNYPHALTLSSAI
jgi:hypothetical protein